MLFLTGRGLWLSLQPHVTGGRLAFIIRKSIAVGLAEPSSLVRNNSPRLCHLSYGRHATSSQPGCCSQ